MRDEKRTRIALLLMILGNTAQRLYVRCVVRFFGRLPRNSAGILPYGKGFLSDMTENLYADCVQSRQAGFVRCCPKETMCSGNSAHVHLKERNHNTMSNKVKVVICGKDFTLQTAESSNYVFGLARTLESRITEITDANSSASPFTAAIMVGLATLDDLNKANAKLDSIRDQSKEYVDEAGKTRLERDAAMQQVEALKSRIAELERELREKDAK